MKSIVWLVFIYLLLVAGTSYYFWKKIKLPTAIALVSVAFLLLVIMIVLYTKRTVPLQVATLGEGTVEIFFFYTTWCPYCKKSKPAWDAFKEQWQGKTYNGYRLIFSEVDCDRQEGIAKQYQVQEYPTIKLLKGKEIMDYNAKPTADSLNQFLSVSLSNG